MFSDLVFRLRSLFRRGAVENELDDELRFHLEQQVEKYMRAGFTRDEALRRTRLEFGGLSQVKEDCRESRGITFLETTIQDIRYALRQMRRTPAFTITVLLTLALGIGANAAIFTLMNAVLQKNLPVTDPASLIRLGDANDCCVGMAIRDSYSLFSTDAYEQLKKGAPEFEELAAMQAGFVPRPVVVRRDATQEVARSVMGEFVSGNYFRTFGLQPQSGRLLMDSDDLPGAPMTAVLSYATWQHSYAGDASVVGSTFFVNTKPVTIVGIAPKDFFGDRLMNSPPDFYLPIESMPTLSNVPYVHDPEMNWLYIIGRVKPGVALAPLQEKISVLLRHSFTARGKLTADGDKTALSKIHIVLSPGGAGIQRMQEQYGAHLRLLMSISALVLLIACANIANLLLVRGVARVSEMSVRTALGAMRGRIIRQLLTESILLSVLGGIAGLCVAYVAARMLLMLVFPGSTNLPISASPSGIVIGFAFLLSLITGVFFGFAPALTASRANPADASRTGSRTTASGTSLMQRGLVVFQVALSLVLLVGAGLFLQSLSKLQGTDLKLESKNRYIVHINPQAAGYGQAQLEALYRTMEDRFHALPGVTKVGIGSYTPMEDNNNGWGIQIQGRPEARSISSIVRVNADYFASVGTHVLRGRGIEPTDIPTAPKVAIVNQSFVNQLFKPGENPIGQRFGFPGPESSGDWQIVGVVEDTAYMAVQWQHNPRFFVPLMQRPPSMKAPIEVDDSLYASAIVLETDRPMENLESQVQKTLSGINPNLTVVRYQTFANQISETFGEARMISRLTFIFGALALMLATIGLYGVTAYGVVRRTPEIGIRMALGAERGGVIAMVLKGAMLQTALGLLLGLPVALFCVRFVKALLYEISNVDTVVMAGAIVALASAAFIACIFPARRAASIDPVQALRME